MQLHSSKTEVRAARAASDQRGGGGAGRGRACAVILPAGNPAHGAGLASGGRGSPGPQLLPPPRIVQQAGPRAAGPWTGAPLGMVSKALQRLVSAVNRRRMKLLLGIALIAYVACECAQAACGEPHSFLGTAVAGPGAGELCAAPGRPRSPVSLPPSGGTCASCSHPFARAPEPFHPFHFCGKTAGQLGRRPLTV